MKKKLSLALILLAILSCGKKEIKPEEQISRGKIEKQIESKEPTKKGDYNNIYYLQFLSFLSNKHLYINLDLSTNLKNYHSALSNEFEINSLSRRKNLETAISNYTELIKSLSNTEEINFIYQRIGICKYKNGDFKEAYKILSEVYFSNEKNMIDNEELKFYLALSLLAFKKDATTAYTLLSSSEPHISTLPPPNLYYALAKVSLLAQKTNEAKAYLNKSISAGKDLFSKKYRDEALLIFKDDIPKDSISLKSFTKKDKEEIFKININLPLIYNELRDLSYFYEMPAILYRPSIALFRDMITNSVVLKNRYYCFYEDIYFKNESYFRLLICGIPANIRVSDKKMGIKDTYFVSDSLLLLANIETNYVITNILEPNSISVLTNEIQTTNCTKINLPFKYLWKIEKVEANNDDYWDYLFIGINATNEMVLALFDVKKESFIGIITNNIGKASFSILINKNPLNPETKTLTIFDKKTNVFNF
ncbi:MAG: tetratricopeptide repeat protein [Brevinematia bacterium]